MKSTGEVMGIDGSFGAAAFAKAQIAAGTFLPRTRRAFISVPDVEKEAAVPVARRLAAQGFFAPRHARERRRGSGRRA